LHEPEYSIIVKRGRFEKMPSFRRFSGKDDPFSGFSPNAAGTRRVPLVSFSHAAAEF
jgi:hypothetical protein